MQLTFGIREKVPQQYELLENNKNTFYQPQKTFLLINTLARRKKNKQTKKQNLMSKKQTKSTHIGP